MLSMNNYPKQYIEECRAKVDAQLSSYRKLATAVRQCATEASLPSALESFEPTFFNNMVLVLDSYFVHRSRTIEKKDGNPLNEVRVLCNSMMHNNAVMMADSAIKLDPGKSVLGYQPGDDIRIAESDFSLISEAFFAEIEHKYL